MPMQRKGACALLLLLATSALAAPASPPTSGLPINTSAPAHTGSRPPGSPKPAASPAPTSSPPAPAPSTPPASPKPAAATPAPSPAAPAQKPAAVLPTPVAAATPSHPVTPSFLGFRVTADGAGSPPAMPPAKRPPSPTPSSVPYPMPSPPQPAVPSRPPSSTSNPPPSSPASPPPPSLAGSPTPSPPAPLPPSPASRPPPPSLAGSPPPSQPTPPPPSAASPPPPATFASAAAALQDSRAALSLPSEDAALKAAASNISSAAAAAGLLRMTASLQTSPAAQAPIHSMQPAAKPPSASLAAKPLCGAVAPLQANGPAAARLKIPVSMVPSPAELQLLEHEQEAHQNMQAAYQMVDKIESYAPAPQPPLSTVPAPPVPEQAPVQVNTAYTGAQSAVSVVIRISGKGVTPFTPQKQQQLINIFADATAGNVSASQFSVLLVSSAYSSRHRSMLQVPIVAQGNNPQGAPLSNVVDVTLEVDAGTPGNAAAVRNQLAALVSGKTYLDVALQRAGMNTWSIKLLAISIVQPSQSSSGLPCQKHFGKWCLDKSGLTIPLAILIIAFGGAVLAFTFILILVIREVKKNNGKTAALEYPKSDSVTMRTHILKYVIGNHAQPSPSKA